MTNENIEEIESRIHELERLIAQRTEGHNEIDMVTIFSKELLRNEKNKLKGL